MREGWTARKFTSFEELKDDEYAYWQSRSVNERANAAWEMSLEFHHKEHKDGFQLQRTLVSVERRVS